MVKVTPVPEQTEVAELEILTDGNTFPVTVKVIPVDVAEVFAKQVGKVPPAFKTALTIFPFEGMKLNVLPLD